MSRVRSLAKNTGVLMIAKAATQLINFLLLPIYTTVLSTSEYGQVDLFVTASMIVVPLLTLQLEQAVFRYLVGKDGREDRSCVISSSLIAVLALIVVASAVYIPVAVWLGINSALTIYLFYVAQALMTVLLQVARGMGDNAGYGIGSVVSAFFSISLSIVFVAGLNMSVEGALLGYVLGYVSASVYLIARTHLLRYLHMRCISFSRCRKMLSYSLPLVFNQISSWAINYSDRLIILGFLGSSANGVYAVAAKISNALNTFFGVYNLAWTESAVLNSNDEDYSEYLSRVITATMKAYLYLDAVIICFVPIAFPVLIGVGFREAYWQIPILLLGMFFSGMAATLGSVYIAHEKTASVGATTFLSGVLNVALNLLTVRAMGLYSASVATLIAFAALFMFRYFDMRKFQRVHIVWRGVLVPFLLLIAALVPYVFEVTMFSSAIGVVSLVVGAAYMKRCGVMDGAVSKILSRVRS